MARRLSQKEAGLRHGWRSGLEEALAAQLKGLRVKFEYETLVIPYIPSAKPRRYTPDFLLPSGIIIESKGRFTTADRQKMLLIKEQYPDLDIRFVFSNARQRISKSSKTTYAVWAESKGFGWSHREIPIEWIREPKNLPSIRTIKRIREAS